MIIIWVLLAAILIKFVLNFVKWVKLKRYYNLYWGYLAGGKLLDKLYNVQQEIIELVNGAGISDKVVPYVESVGYGLVGTGNAPALQNLASRRQDVVFVNNELMQRAIGVYRRRMLQAFSPVYWLECIIYLPQKILNYIGFDPNTIGARIFTVVVWILEVILLPQLYMVYETPIKEFWLTYILK